MHTLKLQDHTYFTENILKSLKQNRIISLIDFLQEDPEKLSTLTKLNLPQILDIRNEFFSKHSSPMISGISLLKIRSNCFIPTGIDNLDSILENGIPFDLITEVCGLAGCGKTQLCMQLAINTAKKSKNGVLYVDTKGDFSAIRIQKILDKQGLSHKDMAIIMLKIKVIRIWNMNELLKLLESLKNKSINIEKLSLIIVDSLPCLMFQHFGDDNKLGLTFLNRVVNTSRYLGKELKIGFIYVNIQTRWIDQDIPDLEDIESTSIKDTYTEKRNRCLGKYWESIPALVIMLERNNELQNSCSTIIINVAVKKHLNPFLVKKCTLNIDERGVY